MTELLGTPRFATEGGIHEVLPRFAENVDMCLSPLVGVPHPLKRTPTVLIVVVVLPSLTGLGAGSLVVPLSSWLVVEVLNREAAKTL